METWPGIGVHPPGQPSRGAVLDVGLKCPHACRFCYYSFWKGSPDQFRELRRAPLRATADCLQIIELLAGHGLNHLDITGGEPTVHAGLTTMVRQATRLGLATRLITLGQFLTLTRRGTSLLADLLAAGLTDLLFSLHAATPQAFQSTCGGRLDKVLSAMELLDLRGVQYGCNVVIMDRNRRQLPEIARLAVRQGVYVVNFIAFNAYHAWRGQAQAASLQAAFQRIRPWLEEAAAILVEAGAAVNIRFVPLCAFPSLVRHVVGVLGVPYDPYEWRNRCLNHEEPPAYCATPLEIPPSGVRDNCAFFQHHETLANGTVIWGRRGERFKLFPAQCQDCGVRNACDGVDPVYLERFGAAEFTPLQLPPAGRPSGLSAGISGEAGGRCRPAGGDQAMANNHRQRYRFVSRPYSSFTIHHSPFTIHHSSFTTHHLSAPSAVHETPPDRNRGQGPVGRQSVRLHVGPAPAVPG